MVQGSSKSDRDIAKMTLLAQGREEISWRVLQKWKQPSATGTDFLVQKHHGFEVHFVGRATVACSEVFPRGKFDFLVVGVLSCDALVDLNFARRKFMFSSRLRRSHAWARKFVPFA